MRTVTPYRLPGYVCVGSGIRPEIDSPTLFRDISTWNKWREQFRDVELVPLMTESLLQDVAILPAPGVPDGKFESIGEVSIKRGPTWRLRALWLNFWRRRLNRLEVERQRRYFAPESIESRVKASQ